MNSIESLTSKLYYELEKMENGDFAQKTSMECNENDDDWADSNLEEDNKELESYPIFTKDELSDFADWEDGSETTEFDAIPNPIDEKTLLDYVKLINVAEELIRYRDLGRNITNNLYELSNQKKLEDFYSNEEFSSMFDLIMNHDKNKSTYYFHGTQCLEDAESIIDTGLGMMKSSLSSTTYKEFTKDDVIMYERGFGGEIGRDAIVIIDYPTDGTNIVKEADSIQHNLVQDFLSHQTIQILQQK